jgi:hypothetical protein
VAESEQVSSATYDARMSNVFHSLLHTQIMVVASTQSIWLILCGLDGWEDHWLEVGTGRWAIGGTQRTQRYCNRCMAYAVR